MDIEALKAQMAELMDTVTDNPDDLPQAHARVQEMLEELRAMGQTPPEELVRLEARLAAEAQGRPVAPLDKPRPPGA